LVKCTISALQYLGVIGNLIIKCFTYFNLIISPNHFLPMKAKFLLSFGMIIILLTSPILAANLNNDTEPKAKYSPEVQRIVDRVNELKEIDRSTLTKVERKELKNEVRELKDEANAVNGNGVYLSVGAVIIIILLLILIL